MKKDDWAVGGFLLVLFLVGVFVGDVIAGCRSTTKCPDTMSAEEIEKRISAEAGRRVTEIDVTTRLFGVDIPDFPLTDPYVCQQGVDPDKEDKPRLSDITDAFIGFEPGKTFMWWRWAPDYTYADYRMAIKLSPRVLMHVYAYRARSSDEKLTFYSARMCDVRDLKCVNEIANEFVDQ